MTLFKAAVLLVAFAIPTSGTPSSAGPELRARRATATFVAWRKRPYQEPLWRCRSGGGDRVGCSRAVARCDRRDEDENLSRRERNGQPHLCDGRKKTGFLAVTETLWSWRDTGLLSRAIGLAEAARHPSAPGTRGGQNYDYTFADVTCDLAQDLLVIGDHEAARAWSKTLMKPRLISHLCASVGLAVSSTACPTSTRPVQCCSRPSALPVFPQPVIIQLLRGGFADGLYMEIISTIFCRSSTVLAWRASSPRWIWEAFASGHTGHSRMRRLQITIGTVPADDTKRMGRVDSSAPPPFQLTELLFTMAALGLPGESERSWFTFEEAIAAKPGDSLSFTIRASLGAALLAAGNSTEAEAQFDRVRHEASERPDFRDFALVNLARAYAAGGDLGRSSELVEQFFPPTTDTRAATRRLSALQYVATAAVQAGRPAEALRIVNSEPSWVRDVILSQIVRTFADQGDFRDAEQWARTGTSGSSLGRRLGYIAARAACASSTSAQWIVGFSFERDLAKFPESVTTSLPPVCQRGKGLTAQRLAAPAKVVEDRSFNVCSCSSCGRPSPKPTWPLSTEGV